MKLLTYLFAISTALNANTLIQFGGNEAFIADTNWQAQIGADQIIDWVGNSSAGSAASGNLGGPSGQAAGATLTSETHGLTLSSVAVSGGSSTYSSGNPKVLGVGPINQNAKFNAGATNEQWRFAFDDDVTLRQLVFSALGYDGEEIKLSLPGVSSPAIFTRTDPNMAAVSYPSPQTQRFVYTLPGTVEVPGGSEIILEATNGSWGLQAIVVEHGADTEAALDPNVDDGAEPPPSTVSGPVPNVIIFIADDMGIGDTSAYQDLTGNADAVQIDTPQLERLAKMGTRFTDAHTNAATCSPSRISLLTGTYSFRSPLKTKAVRDNDHTHGVLLPGRRTTIGHMLQRAGYRTYGYGKWHLALRGDSGRDTDDDGVIDVPGSGRIYEGPIEVGFDTYTGTPGNFSYGASMIQDKQYMRFGSAAKDDYSLVPINDPVAVPWIGQGPGKPTDPNLSKVQPAVFENFQNDLQAHMNASPDQPFFIYYASHSNHDPYVPANYDPGHPEGPRASLNGQVIDRFVTKAGGIIPINTVADFSGDGIPDPDYDNNPGWIWNDAFRKKWWDHVTEVDDSGSIMVNGPTNRAMMVQENDIIVGYMLDYLEQTDDPRNPGHKLIENTIFIFTSDNGADIRSEAAVGALPQSSDSVITNLRGFKGTRWEGANRVPFIAAWPGPAAPDLASGIPPASTSSALFGLNDIYATLAEAIGHRLAEDEAVDSESLLSAWISGQEGVVRSTDLLYKYEHRIFSRRGEMKLSARDGDYDKSFPQDRFGDDNNLDFDDMVLDFGKWAQYVSVLVDLSVDLSESNDLGATPRANAMLDNLQTLASQGYSRSGAAAFENGFNFEGGDLLLASNWHAYKSSRNNRLPEGAIPGIVAVDGTAAGDLFNRTLVHRSGTLSYSPGSTGGLRNTFYELDGGTLQSDAALRLQDARMSAYRGLADIGNQPIEMNQGNAVLEISGGTVAAEALSVGEAGDVSDGFKIVRFKGGSGSMELGASDPIGFGDDGSPGNDFIDFATGARGRLVTTCDAAYFSSLWDAGHLRIDGVVGATGQFADSGFALIALGDGRNALVLP